MNYTLTLHVVTTDQAIESDRAFATLAPVVIVVTAVSVPGGEPHSRSPALFLRSAASFYKVNTMDLRKVKAIGVLIHHLGMKGAREKPLDM